MIWIFAAVALVLCVYSPGFRKFVIVTVGASALIAAILAVCLIGSGKQL
jgi:membrane protein implicated in regulation of membrane protease activity